MFTEEEILHEISSYSEEDDCTKDPTYEDSHGESDGNTSDNEPDTPKQQMPSKKRKRNKTTRAKNKERKDKGEAYTSSTGNKIESKSIGPACSCTRKCFEDLGEEKIMEIFNGFWSLADRDKQNSYLFGCLEHYRDDFCAQNGYQPVSADKYRRIFVEDFNIGFKSPKSDTCKTCDQFQVEYNQAKLQQNEAKAAEILNLKELHQRKAEAGQENIKLQTEQSRCSEGEPYHVVTFDLQQALPTPKLSTGPAFYKRKLWTYNLNVHDCCSDTGYCYVWDESAASRGSEDIASCVKKYTEDNDIKGGTFVAISDNCAGQNKNWNMQFLWLYFLATGRFEKIEHHFPLSGHSMLPSDRDFALIENHVRRHVQYVYSNTQWRQVIAESSPKLKVFEMSLNDFYKLSDFKDQFTVRSKTTDGYPVNFKNVVRFRLKSDESFGLVETSISFNTDVWSVVSVKKRGRPKSQVAAMQLRHKYTSPRTLDKQKVDDVVSLLPTSHPSTTHFTSA